MTSKEALDNIINTIYNLECGTTYEQDVKDYKNTKYLLDYGIYDCVIEKVDEEYAQDLHHRQ